MTDLEGITGFELGNVLDAEPVLMDKRKKMPRCLIGCRGGGSSLFKFTMQSSNYSFICQ